MIVMSARSRSLAVCVAAFVAASGCSRGKSDAETAASAAPEAPAAPASSTSTAGAEAMPASDFMPIEMQMTQQMAAAVGATAEETWAKKMVVHHQGGVDLSQALLSKSPNGPMHAMAQKAIEDQTKEKGELTDWLKGHAGAGGGANPFAQAEKTMSDRMMAASGATPDETWARKMIEHHRGAIEMAKIVLRDAKDAKIRQMAQMTIDKQTKDVSMLESMLKK